MNQNIKKSIQTKLKRRSQICKTFEFKLDASKLSKQSDTYLYKLFIEAKWYYNYCLEKFQNKEPINTTLNVVQVVNKDKIKENREITALSSQMKQSIMQKLFESLLSIKALRKKKMKTGSLKFKTKINSIILTQHGKTYRIKKNKLFLQGYKKGFVLYGLQQLDDLPENTEYSRATLNKIDNDYYLKMTIYYNKDSNKEEYRKIKGKAIGIDFGCETQLTLSNGIKISYEVPISNQIKIKQKKLSKQKKGSKNREKTKLKIAKLYHRSNNQKKDIKDKIVHSLISNYEYVIFQDENIKEWQKGNHGKKINKTAIGGIIRDLKVKSHTPIMINRFYPSTRECFCGNKIDITLWDREFKCDKCGLVLDRDIKSAIKIKDEGMHSELIPMERRDSKPVEQLATTRNFLDSLSRINRVTSKLVAMNQEA